MTLLVDIKFMRLVSPRLELFDEKRRGLWWCRCPICGDSKKRATMRRFYFLEYKGMLMTKCHNCGFAEHISTLLEMKFPTYFKDYRIEKYKENSGFGNLRKDRERLISHKARKPIIPNKPDVFDDLPRLSDLPRDHYARKYMEDRLIPYEYLKEMFYAEDFKATAMKFDEEAACKIFDDDQRVVIPFYDKNGKVLAMQGRSLNPREKKMKYITMKVSPDVEKTYGLDKLDTSKPVRVVEGPIDSMFVNNCVATCDSSLTKYDGDVYIYDNQPRNLELVKQIEKTVNSGKTVVIWPEKYSKYKDINDMVKGGISLSEIEEVIQKHSYSGAQAKLMFSRWRKL